MAFLPLIVALIMLLILRQSSVRAGLATLATTLLIVESVPAFFLAGSRIALATEQGVGASLTVLTLLWPGLPLYHLIRGAGGFSVAALTLTRLCPDRDLQLLWLVLGVCPFIEAVSGFGLGIVVIVPLLAELGCDSAQAAMLGIVGQVTTTWGAMGVATLLGAQLSGLPAPILGARSALLLAPLSVSAGLLTLVIGGGPRAVQRAFLPAILAGSLLALGEWAWSQFPGVDLAGLLASLSVMTGLWVWGWSRGCQMSWRHRLVGTSHVHAHGSSTLAGKGAHPSPKERNVGVPAFWRVLAPYLFLSCGLLMGHVLCSLLHVSLVLLANPGVWVAGAAGLSWPLLRIDVRQGKTALCRTLRQVVPVAGAVTCFLVVSALMQHSGMTSTLGSAAAGLGSSFLWVAPWLGAFSGWMTGSVVGGNAMFVLMQQTAAARSHVPADWIVAAQNATCSLGRMLSPPILLLAASTAQLPGGEGYLVRKMGLLIIAAVLVSCLVLVGIVTCSLIMLALLVVLLLCCAWLLPSVIQGKAPIQAEWDV